MTDDRHSPDSFFLVAEADWRLYRDHCVGDRDWMAEVDAFSQAFLQGPEKGPFDNIPKVSPAAPVQPMYQAREGNELAAPLPLPEGAAASSSEGAGPPRPDRLGSPAPQADSNARQQPSFYGWTKASRHDAVEAYITRDLKDLIQIANRAARYHQRDDVVWYSWNGKGKAKNKPSYGSTLLGISKTGAMKLKACMEDDTKPMHWDIYLIEKLYE